MLRNSGNAWLMYLRHAGDSGFVSFGEAGRAGTEKYLLSHGQEDEYPLAWCIELEQCYKAIAYFYVNEGAMPDWVQWHEA
ncbi:Imm1 family immunity protein [Ideonella alba]|nr:Imm1 family immunity protein [Ideonella alba]